MTHRRDTDMDTDVDTDSENAPDTGPAPHAKVSRQDWLDAARKVLIEDGVSEVKILTLGRRLGVSRSSFYWYFTSRQDLLDALLAEWESATTAQLVTHCDLPAATITQAVAQFFRCFINPLLFQQKLDFTIREWSRRDAAVHAKMAANDAIRQAAIQSMFERHGYPADEADIRARILYYQQIGYYALDIDEPLADRQARVAGYLYGFTGRHPSQAEVDEAVTYAEKHAK